MFIFLRFTKPCATLLLFKDPYKLSSLRRKANFDHSSQTVCFISDPSTQIDGVFDKRFRIKMKFFNTSVNNMTTL